MSLFTAVHSFAAIQNQTIKAPIIFEENRGQIDPGVLFTVKAESARVLLTRKGATFVTGVGEKQSAVHLSFPGSNGARSVFGERPTGGISSYIRGSDSSRWISGVRHFQSVRAAEINPGVDIVYYSAGQDFEYDVVLHPNAKPRDLRFRFDGAQHLSIDHGGNLIIETANARIVQHRPNVWQRNGAVRSKVLATYVLRTQNIVALHFGDYDNSRDLVVDPVLTFSTYLGGSGDDLITGVAVDNAGYIFVTGTTTSPNFPTSAGAYQTYLTSTYSTDLFVTKLDPFGTTVLYSTFIGGNSNDTPVGIVTDQSGFATIVGYTTSPNFPTTAGALSRTQASMFITRLNQNGTGLALSTYFGQYNYGAPRGIATDTSGNLYITGYCSATSGFNLSSDTAFTKIGPVQAAGYGVAFVAKLSPNVDKLIYLTYFTSSNSSTGERLTIDSSNQVYLTGETQASNFPTTPGAFQTTTTASYPQLVFVLCLNSAGTSLAYSTFLGGTNGIEVRGIGIDSARNVYVAGDTLDTDFPTTVGAFSTTAVYGAHHGFVTKLNPSGSALVYSTYLDGSGEALIRALAVDSAGRAIVTGLTGSTRNFPLTTDAFGNQATFVLASSATSPSPASYGFLSVVNSLGSGLAFSSFVGAPVATLYNNSAFNAISLDTSGNPVLGGNSLSTIFPTTSGAYQRSNLDSPPSTSYVGPDTLFYGSGVLTKVDLSSSIRCSQLLSINTINAPVAGASGIVSVSTSPGCPWNAVAQTAYGTPGPAITLSNAAGVGSGSFSYNIPSSSTSGAGQSFTIYVGDASITVTQPAGGCLNPIITTNTHLFPASGGSGYVSVQTASGCLFSVSSSANWLGFNTNLSSGPSNLIFYVTANSGADRSGTLTVGDYTIYIAQYGTGTSAAGSSKVGVMQPSRPDWALDSNGNGVFDVGDRLFSFLADPTDIAVVGDWNGDGHMKVGVYRGGFFCLDLNNNGVWDGPSGGDLFIALGGQAGDIPVVGDWNGNGKTKVGVYRHGFFILDTNGNGVFDSGDQLVAIGGYPGEQPVIGDWNGDGRTKVGVLDGTGRWILDYNGNGVFDSGDKVYSFPYGTGYKPVVGDWNGDKKSKIGVFISGFWILDYNGNGSWDDIAGGDRFYAIGGNPGETPVVGDWNGSGTAKVGVYTKGFWILDYNGNGSFDGTGAGQDRFIALGGTTGEQPVVGPW